MNRRTVSALVVNDLRQLARNPRVLVFAVALPLLIWPLMWFLTSLTTERRQERLESRTYFYAVADDPSDTEHARDAAIWLERALAVVGDEDPAEDADASDGPAVNFERVEAPADFAAALDEEELHVLVAWESGTADDGANDDVDREAVENTGDGAPRVALSYRADIDASDTAEAWLRRALQRTRVEVREQRLAAAGFEVPPGDLLPLRADRDRQRGPDLRTLPRTHPDRDHRDDDARPAARSWPRTRWPARRNAARWKPC